MKKTLLAFFISFLTIAAFSQGGHDGDVGSTDPPAVQFQPSISIYPNPATNFISVDEDENVKTLAIFNLVGRKLLSFDNIRKEKWQRGGNSIQDPKLLLPHCSCSSV